MICINAFRGFIRSRFQSIPIGSRSLWSTRGIRAIPPVSARRSTLAEQSAQLGQQDIRQGAGPGGTDQINYQSVVRAGTDFTLFYDASVRAMKEGKGSDYPRNA